jgi:hypothetical protein
MRVSRIWSVLTVFALVALFVVTSLPALGQGERVPRNGDFLTNLHDWAAEGTLSWDPDGRGGGAAKICGINTYALSSPVVVGSGAVFSFYTKGASYQKFRIFDYGTSLATAWQSIETVEAETLWSYDIGAYAGATIAVQFWANDGYGRCAKFSDVTFTNSANAPTLDARYLNGAFQGGLSKWMNLDGPNSIWDPTVGHTANGSWKANGYGPRELLSRRVRISENSLSLWNKGSSPNFGVAFSIVPLDGTIGRQWIQSWPHTVVCCDWNQEVYDVSAYVGMDVTLWIWQDGYSWVDDVCPGSGCITGDQPTATPGATATGGGGGGPYPTIDWREFPTYPPFPTFPNFPTQMPFPTAVYGPGTAVPITGSVSITGMVKIDDSTPVRVKVDDSTPVRVKVDDSTPVRVQIGPDPKYTPVRWENVPIERKVPTGGPVMPTLITSPSQSSIEYGQGGSATNPINMQFGMEDWVWTLPGIPGITGEYTIIMDYYYPTVFVVAGIDLLPGLHGLAAAFVVVFIIQRIKKR